jgi:hypothetical protein
MPADTPSGRPNGAAGSWQSATGLTAELLGPAPSEAIAVIYTQMAHAVGLAMQNIVAQQQTLNTINNAIATKALNLLADKDPSAALAEVRKQFDSTTSNTVDALSRLVGLRPSPATDAEAPRSESPEPEAPPSEPGSSEETGC